MINLLYRLSKGLDSVSKYMSDNKAWSPYVKRGPFRNTLRWTFDKAKGITKAVTLKPLRFVQKHPEVSLTAAVYLGGGAHYAKNNVDNLYKLGSEKMSVKKSLEKIASPLIYSLAETAGRPLIEGFVTGAVNAAKGTGKAGVYNKLVDNVIHGFSNQLGKGLATGVTMGLGLAGLYGAKATNLYLTKKRAMQVFEEVIKSPDLQNVPREELLKYFQTILRFAPKIAEDPVALHNYLKQASVYGSVDLQTLKMLEDVNNNLGGRR